MDKKRNLEYEKKFRAYLFSFDFEIHKQICINLNVVPSTPATRKAICRNNRGNMEFIMQRGFK